MTPGDLPTFTANSLTVASTSGGNLLVGGSHTASPSLEDYAMRWNDGSSTNPYKSIPAHTTIFHAPPGGSSAMSAPVAVKSKLRVVRVFLVDPDERVPVAKRILHRSDELTTDSTDQELFFDIPVNDLLKAHNAERATVEWDEKTADGTRSRVGLKEVRIRDLILSVTTIAEFTGRAA